MKGFVAAALLLAAPGFAFAQDEWEEQVYEQLDAVFATLEADGWVLDRDYYVDSLDEDDSEDLEMPLFGRRDYAVVGVCDTDCGDVDLYLYDRNDRLVVEDTATDDFPVLEFNTSETQDYTLRVRMYECSAEPCRYGVGVFTR